MTVDAEGIVRLISLTWGSSTSEWTYAVSYSGLGATPAPVAPEDARPLRTAPINLSENGSATRATGLRK